MCTHSLKQQITILLHALLQCITCFLVVVVVVVLNPRVFHTAPREVISTVRTLNLKLQIMQNHAAVFQRTVVMEIIYLKEKRDAEKMQTCLINEAPGALKTF